MGAERAGFCLGIILWCICAGRIQYRILTEKEAFFRQLEAACGKAAECVCEAALFFFFLSHLSVCFYLFGQTVTGRIRTEAFPAALFFIMLLSGLVIVAACLALWQLIRRAARQYAPHADQKTVQAVWYTGSFLLILRGSSGFAGTDTAFGYYLAYDIQTLGTFYLGIVLWIVWKERRKRACGLENRCAILGDR